jgi:hypothetical protein
MQSTTIGFGGAKNVFQVRAAVGDRDDFLTELAG